jgi:hypothetical protein
MGTLCSGGGRWGMLLGVSDRFGGLNGDQHRLGPQELHERPPNLAAWPIAPPHGLSRNSRSEGGRTASLSGCGRRSCRIAHRRSASEGGGVRRRRARPEHGAHPARLEGGARFLTLFAQWAGATMADAGRIQHTQGTVVLRSAFLHVQRMACWTPQRPIGVRCKSGARKPMSKGRPCPLG